MRDNSRRWLWPILAASVLVRLGVAFYLGDVVDAPPLLTDQRSYHALAVRLLGGHGYSFDRGWYPFTPADTPTAHWSFLYSLFVAGVYALFGAHPLAVRLVQAILGGLALPWMVYRLARTVFRPSPALPPKVGGDRGGAEKGPGGESHPLPPKVGGDRGGAERGPGGGGEGHLLPLIAAAIAAIYSYFILYAATLMTETFYIATVLWSLERGLELAGRLRARAPMRQLWPLAASLGLSLGIATLLRQSILPWVPVLFLYLFWIGWRAGWLRPAVTVAGIVGLILAACVLPWTARNYVVYHDFLLLNSNAGYAMYSAQHPMHGTVFREFDAAPLPEGWWGRPEPELDRDLMRQGIRFVLDEPGRYLLLSLSRVRAFFEFWPTPDTTLLHNVGRTGSFGLFLPFMLYGLYLSFRRQPPAIVSAHEPGGRRTFDLKLVYLFIAFYTLLHVLTWAMVRYRLLVDAVSLPFAALALFDLYERGRRWLAARIKGGRSRSL